MLTWGDIAMMTFSCVAANHLGLVAAMEGVLKRKIPIVNCPKCFTFWGVLVTAYVSGWNMVEALAVAFFSAYVALWLELGMGFIDLLFGRLYGQIYSTTDNGDNETECADGGVSVLSEGEGCCDTATSTTEEYGTES